jgi:hypothetical protein
MDGRREGATGGRPCGASPKGGRCIAAPKDDVFAVASILKVLPGFKEPELISMSQSPKLVPGRMK